MGKQKKKTKSSGLAGAAGVKNGKAAGAKQGREVRKVGLSAWFLALALVLVVGGSILFMVGVGRQIGAGPVVLDAEYYAATGEFENQDGEFLELLSSERFDELVEQEKSFVLFVDQVNCVNADRMREFMRDYMAERRLGAYRMMFGEMKETGLSGAVKYYPSVVVFNKGRVVAFLDANVDEDVDEYNNYEAFRDWLNAKVWYNKDNK